MRTKSIQTVIDQKDYDGIFGVIDNVTKTVYVLFGSDVAFRIVSFDWIVYSYNDADIMKVNREDLIHFIVDNFQGNRRLLNVICKMMKIKACTSTGKQSNLHAANQILALN